MARDLRAHNRRGTHRRLESLRTSKSPLVKLDAEMAFDLTYVGWKEVIKVRLYPNDGLSSVTARSCAFNSSIYDTDTCNLTALTSERPRVLVL